MHRSLVLVVVASSSSASADALLDSFRGLPPAVLVGAHGGRLAIAARAPRGWFFGAETGWAWLVGSSDAMARSSSSFHDNSWCFGARAGYQLASGLAVQARFDRFGVTAPDGSGDVIAASFGVRYSVPIVPMPFAEALVGPAFHGPSASLSAGLGIGVSLLVMRHLAFDALLRDWLVDIGGIHHVPTVTIGITAGFGG